MRGVDTAGEIAYHFISFHLALIIARQISIVMLRYLRYTWFKELNQPGNIVFDVRATKEGQVQVSADLVNVPLDTIVRMFADMAGLAVVPLDNVLYVTSKDNARDLLQDREKLRLQRERQKKEKASEGKDKEKKSKPTTPKVETASSKKSS